MVDRLAGLGIFHPLRAHHVHAHCSRKAEIEGVERRVLAPDLDRRALERFPQVQGIPVNCHFDVANRVAAGQVADCIPGEKQNHLGLAGRLAQMPQGALLIGREPVFQKVDIVRHSVPVRAAASLPSV